uniref:Uncharacterized protein n=1 Tax=Panagrolaimus sp. JU765 TaxID=591449 RepID=A0AC34Q9U6_9BILA
MCKAGQPQYPPTTPKPAKADKVPADAKPAADPEKTKTALPTKKTSEITTPSPAKTQQSVSTTPESKTPKLKLPPAKSDDTVYGFKDSLSERLFDNDPVETK